jgi:hypothetical protein
MGRGEEKEYQAKKELEIRGKQNIPDQRCWEHKTFFFTDGVGLVAQGWAQDASNSRDT